MTPPQRWLPLKSLISNKRGRWQGGGEILVSKEVEKREKGRVMYGVKGNLGACGLIKTVIMGSGAEARM